MNILKKINKTRGPIMYRLTKNIGKSHTIPDIHLNTTDSIKKILISRPNHRLGNLLLLTPLLQEVITTFPDCEIDILAKGNLAPTLFKNYPNIKNIIQLPRKPFKYPIKYLLGCISIKKRKYDLTINAVNGSSSGKIFTQIADSKYKIFGEVDENDQTEFKDHMHMAKASVYSFRNYMTKLGFPIEKNKEIGELDIKLEPFEISYGQNILKELVNNDKKTVCLFTYATGNKCYSKSWWKKLYKKLKREYPDYNIIEVLPMENISKISFKAPTYYSKNLRHIASLIANTNVFIGADSGIMHLASSTQTPTIGLFSITDQNIYQPYGTNNTSINTNYTNKSECIKVLSNMLLNNDYTVSV